MNITIITVSYNSERTISDCIASVNSQSYKDIEHVIIDGASTDNTIGLIEGMSNRVKTISSEPDKGIYDAMNKGLEKATGNVVGFLNSDDFYVYEDAISDIVRCYEKNRVDCVFGNINYVNSNNPERIVRKWESGSFRKGSFRKGWHPAHPAFFAKNEVYEKYGKFNLVYNLAADFEIMLRFLEKEKISNYYFDKAIINMRLGGATNKSLKNIFKQNIECYRAFKKNGISVSPFYPFYRIFPKLKQFF